MKIGQILIKKLIFILISSQLLLNVSKVNSAEEIKIIYSIFSRTIKVDSLKTYAREGKSTKKLKSILSFSNKMFGKVEFKFKEDA